MLLVRRQAALKKRKRALAEDNAALRRRLADGARDVESGLAWLGRAGLAASLALTELGQAWRRPAREPAVAPEKWPPPDRPPATLFEDRGEAAPTPCAVVEIGRTA